MTKVMRVGVKEQIKGATKGKSRAVEGALTATELRRRRGVVVPLEGLYPGDIYCRGSEIRYCVEKKRMWVNFKSVCYALKLDPAPHIKRIMEDRRYKKGILKRRYTSGKEYEEVHLPAEMMTAWLFTISSQDVDPVRRKKLISYQRCLCKSIIYYGADYSTRILQDEDIRTMKKVKHLCEQIEKFANDLRDYCEDFKLIRGEINSMQAKEGQTGTPVPVAESASSKIYVDSRCVSRTNRGE